MLNPMSKFPLSFVLFVALFVSCGYSDGDYAPSSSSSESVSSVAVTISSPSGNGNTNGPSSGLITAGEWNDLANWSSWQHLGRSQAYSADFDRWQINTADRVSIRVGAPDNRPAYDAEVKLFQGYSLLYTARTNQEGVAELFANLTDNAQNNAVNSQALSLEINGVEFQGAVKLMADGINYFTTATNLSSNRTELAFLVDATGSMSDELNFLKEDLRDVIRRIKVANGNLDVATAAVFYRDEGDDYVTRHSGFSNDISTTVEFIRQQSAHGGGDFPEAVHSALQVAVNELEWSTEARSRIAFLLLDAPPHEDRQVMNEYRSLVESAAAKGIRIVPVTASDIDKATEFLMRQTAIATNGTYVFITNDSGIGNDHIEATVGDYEVEFLNDLLVRLVGEYTE